MRFVRVIRLSALVVLGLILSIRLVAADERAPATKMSAEMVWTFRSDEEGKTHLDRQFPLPGTSLALDHRFDQGNRFLVIVDPWNHKLIKGQVDLRSGPTTWTIGQQHAVFGKGTAGFPYVFDLTGPNVIFGDIPTRNPGIAVSHMVSPHLTVKAGYFLDAIPVGGTRYHGGSYGVVRAEFRPTREVELGVSQRVGREPAVGADLTIRGRDLELKCEWVDTHQLGGRHYEQLRIPLSKHAGGVWQDTLAVRWDNLAHHQSQVIVGWRHDFSADKIFLMDYNTKNRDLVVQFRFKI